MSLISHFILLLRHVSTLQGHPQATVNRLKLPHYISSYVNILHATIACHRCLRMYAHVALTLPSYCSVHTVFLLCIPCMVVSIDALHNLQSLHTNLFSLFTLIFIDLQHGNYNSLTELHTPNITHLYCDV
jgi:hypothetical protein